MARGGSDDINDLLREVDQSLSGERGRSRRPARRAGSYPATAPAERERRGAIAVATTSGGVAAVLVFLLFAVTPFLGAISGAAGAFLGTFIAVLLSRLRHR